MRLWRRTGDAFVTSATLDDAHDRTVRRVAWAPCGTLLAATSFDATCCVWRRSRQDDAWEILATLEGHENEVKGFTQRPSTKSHPPLITHRWRREIRAGAAAPTLFLARALLRLPRAWDHSYAVERRGGGLRGRLDPCES